MKSIAFIVLVVLEVSVLTRAGKECCTGKNEVFNRCGTHCETDCANPGPLRCIKSCNAGCFCKEGYTRQKKYGVCIKKEKCPNKCDKKTEEFTLGIKPCQNVCGTGVDPSCAYTTYMPMTGCFCKEGYIRESIDGKCIPVEECPITCDEETEQLRSGVKSCENVCKPTGVDSVCPNAHLEPTDVCLCRRGFIRDEITGQCIPVAQCPFNLCSIANEEYKCGVQPCESVCGVEVDEICTRARFMCLDNCFCKDGFIRDVNGQCIPYADCPSINLGDETETTM